MTRALPVPLLAGAVVLVLAVTILVARQINGGTTASVSCTSQGACVDILDGPYVAVRR